MKPKKQKLECEKCGSNMKRLTKLRRAILKNFKPLSKEEERKLIEIINQSHSEFIKDCLMGEWPVKKEGKK